MYREVEQVTGKALDRVRSWLETQVDSLEHLTAVYSKKEDGSEPDIVFRSLQGQEFGFSSLIENRGFGQFEIVKVLSHPHPGTMSPTDIIDWCNELVV